MLTAGMGNLLAPLFTKRLNYPSAVGSPATTALNSASTSQALTLPSGLISGNLLVAGCATGGSVTAHSWPSPWIVVQAASGTAIVLSIAVKRVGDTADGTTVTVTTGSSKSTGIIYQIANAGQVSLGVPATGTSTTPDPPALAVPWQQEKTLWLAFFGGQRRADTITAPTNYSNIQFTQNNAGSTSEMAAAQRTNAVIVENPGAFGGYGGSNEWVAETIGIQPA